MPDPSGEVLDLMRSVTAYATPSAKAPFEKTTIQRRDLGPRDVLIKVAFAGICHSDIHTAREEWGDATAPGSAAWSTPAASAPAAWPARSSTA
jgi:NADPH:quinone reductase-like Zn-dependent oxidoreductase